MKTHNTKMKGKKVLSVLLALVMVLSVASPAFSPLMGLIAKAATGDPVELAFNNLFVFEKWATNANSTTVQDLYESVDENGVLKHESKVDPDALVPDIQNGSFKFTKKVSEGVQSYTCYGGPDNNNFTYYMIDVNPNTSYTFHYNVEGDLWSFTPFVFYYDIEGKYIQGKEVFYATPGYGNNHFAFTTPANAEYIQVRFTIGDNETSRGPNVGEATLPSSVYATVSDIAIFKTELYDAYFGAQEEALAAEKEALNLFELEAWASNERTHNPYTGTGSGSIVDITSNSFKLETTSSMFITGAAETTAANNLAHYTVDVNPSTTYSLIYSATENNLPSGSTVYCQNYIVELSSSGDVLGLIGPLYTGESDKNLEFTVRADTDRIQVAFMLINDVSPEYQYCVVEDVGLYETAALNSLPPIDYNVDYETITGYPHRKVYTEGAGNYSELPTPTIPEGKVFAGWYTAEDGKGKLITADTEISYDSYTVYPKFETKLDDGGLKIDTHPTKLTYTLGEKVNTAGLVLEATVTTDGGTNVYKVNSGYRYSPETVATTPGTQTITVTYGGQSVSYDVNVVDSVTESVKVNGTATDVDVTNNEYTFNLTSDFNRYELTYYSDSYVKGTLNTVAADGTTVSEEFFLEPSTNGSFESFIDVFLDEEIYTNIATIKFEVLDKEFGTFELYSVDTILSGVPEDNMQYQDDGTHKVGIDLSMGGSLAYLEELSGNVVASYYGEGQEAQVDYKSMITGGTQITEGVNLINRHDPGRFVQQSYYGTKEDPYKIGDYNGVPWNYNPVQGGNYQFESSKIIDYRITDGEIYVKTRPLDWGKYSDEFANLKDGDYTDNNNNGQWDEGELVLDPKYGDDYITDSYMEAWYVFEDSMVKTYCRFVDYSGYPSNVTTQEMPAFYPIEPLNSFAYYDKDGLANDNDPNTNITPWADDNAAVYVDNPDFWGVSANYNTMLKENGKPIINPKVNSVENWAAFMGSNDEKSFGIGIYSAGVTEFHYGTFPQIYKEPQKDANGVLNTTLTTQFDHADMYEKDNTTNQLVLTMPDMQDATSYIAPVDTMKFESYKPYNYSFYIASGTLNDIREDFKRAKTDDDAAAVANTNIAVPETAYMTPAEDKSKVGQYYVNNIINETSNSIETVADREDKMSFSVHIDEAKHFTVDITNVSNANDDIDLYKVSDNSEVSSSEKFNLNINTGTGVFDEEYYLAFNTTGLGYGEKATAKWTITGYDENNNAVGTYTAYTVLYASERTVGAVAEGRITSGSNNEISSWITGANGVDHSQRAPLGSLYGEKKSAGYFLEDPLVYGDAATTISGTSETPYDYITVVLDVTGVDNKTVNDGNYVIQTATSDEDHSRAQSYLGLLKIDKSRYTNTNQIPNLEIGFDALRISSDKNNSLQKYDTYYVLGTEESYAATAALSAAPSGWTHFTSYTDTNSKKTVPFRETVVPSYTVSDDMEGKYIHALNQGMCTWILAGNRYSTAGTSVLLSLTDKSALRDSVTKGYGLSEEKYSEDSYSKFETELKEAATVLGDPSADQITIENAQKELDDAMDHLVNVYYALKYDNLFSAYEFSQHTESMKTNHDNGVYRGTVSVSDDYKSITVENTVENNDVYAKEGTSNEHYTVKLNPGKEYVFEFDAVSDYGSQVLLFFYDANNEGVAVTNRSTQAGTGNPNNVNSSDTHFAYYIEGNINNHYVMRFTTPENVDKMSFRFGNAYNTVNSSTFSNIKLVEADKYYADVDYEKTEDVYKEYASYGTLPTLTRTGYTFVCWKDEAEENVVTGANIATEHKTIYSQWNEHTYTITYNNNGGESGDENTSELIKYSDTKTLSSGDGFTKTGYKIVGWSRTSGTNSVDYELGETVSGLTAENGDNVILYAVWAKSEINVTFDNLFDFSQFEDNIDSAEIEVKNVTNTGFTIEATSPTKVEDGVTYFNDDCNSEWTYNIPVKPNTKYVFSSDVIFEDKNSADGCNSYEIYAVVKLADGTTNDSDVAVDENCNKEGAYFKVRDKSTFTFTTSADSAYITFRFDVNDYGNTMTVDNIRLWEDDGTTVSPVNKVVGNGNKYGELPTPTKTGYKFDGWKNSDGQFVTKDDIVNSDETVNLYSQWTEITYTVNFSPNGPTDIATAEQQLPKYSEKIIMPDELSWKYGKFVGWSFNPTVSPYANDGSIYAPGKEVNVKDVIPDDGSTVIELHAVWQLTNVFEDDTVIADFGVMLPIKPEENDCDTINYHISPKNPETGEGFGGVLELGFGSSVETKSYEGKYGTFEIYKDGDGKETRYVSYTPNKIVDAEKVEDRVDTVTYCGRIKYLDGSYSELFTNTITVVPASSMLYEENVIPTTNNPEKYQWNAKGASTIAMQDFNSDKATDVYGYDSAYANSTAFSDGTYLQAKVTTSNKRSDTATFDFVGSGFDLIGACGKNTGVQIVKVSVPDNESTTGYSAIRTFIVDTYFTDTNIMTDGLLHQVPIVNFRSDFGKYRVETTAAYLNSSGSVKAGNAIIAYSSASLDNGTVINTTIGEPSDEILNELEALGFEDLGDDVEVVWMDDNSVFNGGTGASRSLISGSAGLYFANEGTTTGLDNYIDGVRIYNPLDGGDGYYKDSEQNATYYNIVTELEMDSAQSNMAYIESGALNFIPKDESGNPLVDENGNPITFDFDAYNNQGGPKGEIYLKEGDAIAFKFKALSNGTASSIMLGMRAIMGNPTIRTTVAGNASEPTTVNSRTEMYYQIATNVLVTTTGVTVIVTNPSDGDDETNNIVAVNNLKLINGPQSKSDSADNPVIMGNTSSGALAPTPVVPDAVTGAEGNTESIPETDVDTDTDVPKADVEEETENNISVAIPGLPAPIASFLEMLFKLLGQLVGSLGF